MVRDRNIVNEMIKDCKCGNKTYTVQQFKLQHRRSLSRDTKIVSCGNNDGMDRRLLVLVFSAGPFLLVLGSFFMV
jgi:hypothetical protein